MPLKLFKQNHKIWESCCSLHMQEGRFKFHTKVAATSNGFIFLNNGLIEWHLWGYA